MSSERRQRIRDLFERSLDLPASERLDFLKLECGPDEELLTEVLGLLENAEKDDDFLEPIAEANLDRPETPTPQTFGDFEIHEEIGRGGMGVVYRARQVSLDRDVAIKVLPRLSGLSDSAKKRFREESIKAAKLNHRGIVNVFMVGEIDGDAYFAMEYIEGRSLRDEIELLKNPEEGSNQILPAPRSRGYLRRVVEVIREIADALGHAHSRGIVHRDIKPHNVMMTPSGQPKIVDFGIARDASMGSRSTTENPIGSAPYMSPEQAKIGARAPVDHRTDVYSLGVVLYELLALRRPFEGQTVEEVLRKIETSNAPRLRKLASYVPKDLEVICSTAMAKEIERRYSDANHFADDLSRFLDHEPILAQSPSVAFLAQRHVRRHWLAYVGTSLLLAAATAAWQIGNIFGRTRGRLVRVSLEVRDAESDDEIRGEVTARQFDAVRGSYKEPLPLGPLPLRGVEIAPGFYRFIVRDSRGGIAELIRHLPDQAIETTLTGVLRPGGPIDTQNEVCVPPTPDFRPAVSGETQPGPTSSSIRLESFYIDQYEVSNREYQRFVKETGHRPPMNLAKREYNPAWDRLPVTGVSWYDAVAYSEWAGKRLPTRYEWERAVRGLEAKAFPWGNEDHGLANTRKPPVPKTPHSFDHYTRSFQDLLPVDECPPRARSSPPIELYHAFGNVEEFTESVVSAQQTVGVQRTQEVSAQYRYVVGHPCHIGDGGFNLSHQHVVDAGDPERNPYRGFRCARSATP